jgi:DNA-binding NarL/FixJ family response regulator
MQDDRHGDYRYKLLENISRIFAFNRLTFHLVDTEGRFSNSLGLNVSNILFEMYAEYYFKTDIFHPLNISGQFITNKKTIAVTDIMSYKQFEETEYYKDFLNKDNLYHEIAMPLRFNNRLIGAIGIFRSKEEGNFTIKDNELLNTIYDYISHNLNDYLSTMQIKNERQIYKNSISHLPMGLVILDKSMNIVNSNELAKSFCLDILNSTFYTDPTREVVLNILPKISFKSIDSSSVIYYELKDYTIKIVPSIVPSVYKGVETYYIFNIIKKSSCERTNFRDFAYSYNLTNREMEIVELLSHGLSNKEIASQLYISTNTVRTHMDNIFNKLSVSSRTAVLYKLGIIDIPLNDK